MFAKIKAAWERSRTVFIGYVIAGASVLVQAADLVGAIDLSSVLPPHLAPFGPFIVATVMIVMRKITTGPVRDAK